jgi:hypothetical protein
LLTAAAGMTASTKTMSRSLRAAVMAPAKFPAFEWATSAKLAPRAWQSRSASRGFRSRTRWPRVRQRGLRSPPVIAGISAPVRSTPYRWSHGR